MASARRRANASTKTDNVFIVEIPDAANLQFTSTLMAADTLIARIPLPISGQGCSVDPTSELLAVTEWKHIVSGFDA